MNTPITMVGTPASTFSVSRIASANRCGANSVLKIASSTPIGSEIAAAIRTMITVPTIAFAMPPPDSPNGAAFWVKKSRFSAGKPFFATEISTIASTATASSAAAVARPSMICPVSLRRRARGV